MKKYQLLILVTHYLILKQSIKALLKMSNEKNGDTLFISSAFGVLSKLGIQSCLFPCQCLKHFSLLLLALQSFGRKMQSISEITHSKSKTKQKCTLPHPKRLSMFDLHCHILPLKSPRIIFPLLLTMFLNKKDLHLNLKC